MAPTTCDARPPLFVLRTVTHSPQSVSTPGFSACDGPSTILRIPKDARPSGFSACEGSSASQCESKHARPLGSFACGGSSSDARKGKRHKRNMGSRELQPKSPTVPAACVQLRPANSSAHLPSSKRLADAGSCNEHNSHKFARTDIVIHTLATFPNLLQLPAWCVTDRSPTLAATMR